MGTIREGNGFGELALMSKKPAKRAATIICDGEVLVASLHKQAFTNSIKAAMERKIDEKVEFLNAFFIQLFIAFVNGVGEYYLHYKLLLLLM